MNVIKMLSLSLILNYKNKGKMMKDELFVSEKKIEKLVTKVAKTFCLSTEEAREVIYEEWDIVENLFHIHMKVKVVHQYLCEEINYTYRIA